MPSTNFQVFNPGSANQETDSQYTADASRSGGFAVDAIVTSPLLNKALYQQSTMIAALAQALVNKGFSPNDSNFDALVSLLANILTTADIPTKLLVVAYTATPTFNAAAAIGWQMILTGNITGITMEGLAPGQVLTFVFQQDSTGGRTVNWGTSFFAGSTSAPNTTPNSVSIQQYYVCDDYIARPLGAMTSIPD